jgi:hypothetical protein
MTLPIGVSLLGAAIILTPARPQHRRSSRPREGSLPLHPPDPMTEGSLVLAPLHQQDAGYGP